MRFKAGTFIVAGEEAIKLNELDIKEQKKLLKKYPHLEHFVVKEPGVETKTVDIKADDAEIIEEVEDENDKEESTDDAEVQSKPKRRRGRPSKSKSK